MAENSSVRHYVIKEQDLLQRQDNTIGGLYGKYYREHIVCGRIYCARFPNGDPVFSLLPHEEEEGSTPMFIRITKVAPTFATYVLCDYPEVGERSFGMSSVMASDLIEIL